MLKSIGDSGHGLLSDAGAGQSTALPTLPTIGRWNDNELILFYEARRESVIVYPPRSGYEFVRRPSRDAAIVELHPWTPLSSAEHHPVRPRDGCLEHGLDCVARAAIEAAVATGFDPFS